ncbi:MAG: LamG domain-containing protein [Candidatus Solibacter sp.]
MRYAILAGMAATLLMWGAGGKSEVWKFDSISRIGGHAVAPEGHPKVIDTPAGKAVQFGGVDDALYLKVHPLAGAATFTWEVIFRPDVGGAAEQRFFHFQQDGGVETRMLFEIRVIDGKWCLDSFAASGSESKALMDRTKLHSLGAWHHAAAVYDGKEYRNYVDGVLEGAGEVHLTPQGAGQTSVGTRFNRKDYFKGAVLSARMTDRALAASEFMKVPKALASEPPR